MIPIVRHLTRAELHARVWDTPITKLAAEFGVSDQGLAKLCRRHGVPTPPRGHWAKLEAGKPSAEAPLPAWDGPDRITIRRTPEPTEAERKAKDEAQERREAVEARTGGAVPIPDTLRSPHPVVARWIAQHREEQERRRREARRAPKDPYWDFGPKPLADLTERDRHRLRVTSAFLREIERQGAVVERDEARGRIDLRVDGETVTAVIVEKMVRDYGKRDETWTAWPDQHNGGLKPTGFLRLTVETNKCNRGDLIETPKAMADMLLPRFIAKVMAMGPILVRQREEREASHREYERRRAEEAERLQRQREDEARWERIRTAARDHEECQRLRAFMEVLRANPPSGEAEIDGRSWDAWVAWAEDRIARLDPLAEPEQLFRAPQTGYLGYRS